MRRLLWKNVSDSAADQMKENTRFSMQKASGNTWSIRVYSGSCRAKTLLLVLLVCVCAAMYYHRDDQNFVTDENYINHFLCKECFKQAASNATICGKSAGDVVDLLIIVLSSELATTSDRDRTRKSWASSLEDTVWSVKLVFLLTYSDVRNNIEVQKEANHNNDIVFGEFGLMNRDAVSAVGLEWAATFCSNAKYFMQTNSNLWINVSKVIDILREEEDFLRQGMLGDCLNPQTLGEDSSIMFTNDCSSSTFVVSMDTVDVLLEVVRVMPLIGLEELYHSFRLQKHHADVSSRTACARIDGLIIGHEFSIPNREIYLMRNCYHGNSS